MRYRMQMAAGSVYPSVVSVATTESNTIAGGHAINMPSGIVAGNLLVVVFGGSGTNQTPSGWAKILESSTGVLAIYTKTATGSEGATVTFNFQSGNTTFGTAIAYQIAGWLAIEGTMGSEAAGNPDCPSHAASWGSAKTLWLAASGAIKASGTLMGPITAPSGYTDTQEAEAGSAFFVKAVGSATLESTDATQNPGVFDYTGNSPGTAVATTLAIRPI